ncbi:branched-chain amino acid ABC transporter permease [Pseudobutyrivibrio xylanivorans]|uniref:Amino acid/amide ABC transporter membrane protein 2, HAAT family (TC 3.A.1.4.-) n=1 Tax=Pseudobutyrivibrio xylanivorans DSM 14809 TaxID=1123012 RepID=A0A1M6FD87_PSEXY|nr:branched-chain amino acid ABC transporter permease [Pseudobutyrivibrio xylanivorans]SHI95613.1 amino acid/amide ABC transporter membrane protein 2, HAAT family (TC 3.A.1.4.-) [Pseudobutyrivibrio xylanivorans DSM 14809]
MNLYKNLNKSTQKLITTIGVIVLLYIVMSVMESTGNLSSLMKGLLVPVCAYSLVAVGLNLCVGYLGELSLGHAGFMCVGAFTSAFFSRATQETIPDVPRFILALVIGTAMAALFGFLIAIPVLRLRGDYLAIVTLAFGEIIKNVINVMYIGKDSKGIHFSIKDQLSLGMDLDGKMLINGPQGITGTPRQSTFTIAVVLLVLALIVTHNFVNSRTGRAVKAIRDNQIAAETVGLPVTKYKLIAFTISAAIAGVGGVLYAHNINSLTATTNNFGYNMSIMILVYVVLGGIGNFSGSVISAVILTMLPELLRGLSTYRMLIYSIVLIVLMLFNWAPALLKWRDDHGLTTAAILGKFKKKEVQ